ncbi:MAG: 50S ribosomal protein L10 [Candidatus Absconditabacterales bacterium]
MAISKLQKKDLIKGYVKDLSDAKTTVIVQQTAVPVSTATTVRKEVTAQDGRLNVVRKRLFLKALKDAGLEEVGLENLEGSVFALYSKENEFGPLKVINKYLKEFKKENKGKQFNFLGGWFEKKRQSGDYVNELANVPTKEESYAKLCYLFNYPLQSFAVVLSEIAKKGGEVKIEPAVAGVEAKAVEPAVAEVENGEGKEETKEEVKAE